MRLILNTPFWFIILCIGLGLLGAFLLYRKDKNLMELSVFWKRLLAGLRFLGIAILSFLLLEPLLEYSKEKIEKPIVVIAHDNSESILFSKDSTSLKQEIKKGVEELSAKLSEKYQVVNYSFGDEIKENPKFDFIDKKTNISGFFKEIQNRYYNKNLGGIVLLSDGIYNSGSNPVFDSKKFKNTPIYTVALGDTTLKKDVFIDQIIHNRLVYEGNKFPVIVEIISEKCSGQRTVVKILKGGKVISEKQIVFNSGNTIKKVSFELVAQGLGLQKYEVKVGSLKDEFSYTNNNKLFFVDVLKSKEKILLLSNSPHPDVNAFKNGLESNENYEVKSQLFSKFTGNSEEYSLLVLFNIPSIEFKLDREKNKTPVLFFLGNQTNFRVFNKNKVGVEINSQKGFTEAQGYVNPNFSSYELDKGLSSFLVGVPPLQVPFTNDYKVSNSSSVALYQKIGPARTKYPLLVFNKSQDSKNGIFIGEGIWKWKFQDFSLNGNNAIFNNWVTQTAQYLITKEDKSQFRVFSKNSYTENEKIKFDAEVYNGSYELVNANEVKMKIVNEAKEDFTYVFTKTGNKYELIAGLLSIGSYRYQASTIIEGKTVTKRGEFTVSEIKLEQNNSVANHQLLYNISEITGGEMVSLNEIQSLSNKIEEDGDMVNVIYQEKDIDDLINMKFIFFLILLLFGVEWFIRKRNGAY